MPRRRRRRPKISAQGNEEADQLQPNLEVSGVDTSVGSGIEDGNLPASIPHLFLPKRLPDAEQSHLEAVELFILQSTHESIQSLINACGLEQLQDLSSMLGTWTLLQSSLNVVSGENSFQAKFKSALASSKTIPLYIRKQNCTIIFQKVGNQLKMETFRAALPSQLVMNSVGNISMKFPETDEFIQNMELLQSQVFAKSLFNLSLSTLPISTPLTQKAGQTYSDVRDVAEPFLITDWLTSILSPQAKKAQVNSIHKKIRDQITLKPVKMSSNLLPFRRSGIWLSIKVSIHLKLLKLTGNDELTAKILYKLIILNFLTDICKSYSEKEDFDFDLASQMIAKLGRRVVKIQALSEQPKSLIKIDTIRAHVIQYVTEITQNIHSFMEIKLFQSQTSNGPSQIIPRRPFKQYLHDLDHSIPFLNAYKAPANTNRSPTHLTDDINASLKIKRCTSIDSIIKGGEILTNEYKLTERLWLYDAESYIKGPLKNVTDTSKIIKLIKLYVRKASEIYSKSGNPLGISQMILCVLLAVEILDKIACKKHVILLDYQSGINLEAFDFLLLPFKEDMILLDESLAYFRSRDNAAGTNLRIIAKRAGENCLGARFASQDQAMIDLKERILKETEKEKEKMLIEVNRERFNCIQLALQVASAGLCQCQHELKQVRRRKTIVLEPVRTFYCHRCKLEAELEWRKRSFNLFEPALPVNEAEQNAVIFELLIPPAISHLRDALAILSYGLIEKNMINKRNKISLAWIDYNNIKNYLIPDLIQQLSQRESVIKLGSKFLNVCATSFKKNRPNIMLCDDNKLILKDNGLECIYNYDFSFPAGVSSPSRGRVQNTAGSIPPLTGLKQLCSFQINLTSTPAPYLSLQKYLEWTNHSQNEVIANQSKCHVDLAIEEFLSLGSIRAGHRIQLRNLFRAIHTRLISLDVEPVLALILQTIWQVGPQKESKREAHLDFEESGFSSVMLETLEALVKQNECNYSRPLILMNATLITTRIVDLNTSLFGNGFKLLKYFRSVAKDWSRKIEVAIQKETDEDELKELQLNLLLVRLCSAFTFNFSTSIDWTKIMSVYEDIVEWLHTISIIGETSPNLSPFLKIILNLGRNVALRLKLEGYITNQKLRQELNLFVQEKWLKAYELSVLLDQIKYYQKGSKNLVELSYLDKSGTFYLVTFDFILGSFLVMGYPQGFLPAYITGAECFQRWFSQNVSLRVQQDGANVMQTTKPFQGKHYKFISGDGGVYIIEIGEDGTKLNLLEHTSFADIFSYHLVQNYTHWYDQSRKILYFRPICDGSDFKLVRKAEDPNSKWHLHDLRNDTYLLSVKSKGFENIAEALAPLELIENISVSVDKRRNQVIAHLSRLGLRFNVIENKMECLEYPGYELIREEAGTLIGLQQGLLLENAKRMKRIFIIPNGDISTTENQNSVYHITQIDLERLYNPPYFVYEFDQVLRRLLASKSKPAWLYLAALHAATSQPLSDPFTKITGTEMGVRILQSGLVWSCSPYDAESKRILDLIRALSPRRYYYGHKFMRKPEVEEKVEKNNDDKNEEKAEAEGSIETPEWPQGLPSLAAYDGFEIIVDKLIEDSERLGPLYYQKKVEKAEDEEEEENSKRLRTRAYFRHISAYNQAVFIEQSYFPSWFLEGIKIEKKEIKMEILKHKNEWVDSVKNAQMAFYCQLNNNVRAEHFQKSSLVKFLFSSFTPNMDGSLNSIKDIFDYDFRTNWFNLYKLAKLKGKTEEDKQLLNLILCAMAYKGKDSLSQLLNIHYISTYADAFNFPEAPNFPPNLGNEMSKDADEVFLIFRNTLLKNVNYARAKHIGILHQTSYEAAFANNLSSTAMFIREIYWPPPKVVTPQQNCMLTAILDQLLIHSSQAIAEVEAQVYQWHWTREFRKFGMKVEKILNKIYDMLHPPPAKNDKKLRVGKHSPVLVLKEPSNPEIINLEKDLNWDKVNKTLFSEVIFFNRSVLPGLTHEHVFKDNLNHLAEMEAKFVSNFEETLAGDENGILLWTGISPRTDSTTLLRYFANHRAKGRPKCIYLVEAMASLWSYMKRLRRCLSYQACGENLDLQKELENSGDGNKHFSNHPEWLLLELELDISIRPIQFDVANQMIKMPGGNGVMQLNMGEGKTSVIVPMLCCVLAEKSVLCRVTVLEPMFEMNHAILSFALGGLLDKRVYTLPCKRDMEIDLECVGMIQKVYEECLKMRGVVLSLPEHRLSFRLLGYDNILKKEIELGLALLKTENWLRKKARDVLDESDELLNAKYQLVYTVGEIISIDGGEMRWISCQKLLGVVRKIMSGFASKYPGAVELSGDENSHEFPNFRLLKKDCYAQFNNKVADKLLESFLGSEEEKVKVKQFLTCEQIRRVTLENILNLFKESPEEKKEFLLFSGYLRRGILTLALSKRWRVEYGVDTTKPFRQMAVPFRAKDVPAESTEFGHPDLAIILTHLSYYYSGLSDNQLEEVLKLLKAKQSSEALWCAWIDKIPVEKVPEYFRSFHGLNLKDPFQKKRLFDLLRRHVSVIDFYLSLKVFPRESKQFPAKLVMTSWDLCYERQVNPVTGFSGTNDTRALLPPVIPQQDLPQLQKTNEEVEKIILQKENEIVKCLKLGATCQDILEQLKADSINILIDSGAVMLDCGNEDVANKWLETNNEIEAVLYFKKNELLIKTRNGRDVPFHLSSYQGRLDRCAVFLDDQHTRGTDIKFPLKAKACVTVGGKMLRSKLIQACMRMRNLGKGQSVAFYLSHEAFAMVSGNGEVSTSSVLEWTRQNTNNFNEEGLVYWAIAGRNYAQRLAAEDSFYYPQTFENFEIDRVKELRLDDKATVLAEQCVDDEVTSLMGMYGEYVQVELVAKIVSSWFRASMAKLKARNGSKLVKSIRDNFERIHNLTKKRCLDLIPEKKHFGSFQIEEEQEKELELEKEAEVEEERVKEQRGMANPAQNKLLDTVKRVVLDGEGVQLVEGIMRLCDIFKDTTFWGDVQPNGWGYEVFATTDFITVISDKYAKTDLFLRPVEYLVTAKREDGKGCLLLLSPFEVNELMPRFRKGEVKCELHMFAQRRREEQSFGKRDKAYPPNRKCSPSRSGRIKV